MTPQGSPFGNFFGIEVHMPRFSHHIQAIIDAVENNQLEKLKTLKLTKEVFTTTHSLFLYMAATRNYGEIADYLISKGMYIDKPVRLENEKQETPLQGAIKCGHKDMVINLIEWGAKINAQRVSTSVFHADDRDPLPSPIEIAIRYSTVEIVRILLDKGADPNTVTLKGETLLILAIERGVEFVSLLLEKKIDPNAISYRRSSFIELTPLCHAVSSAPPQDKVLIIQKLLEHNANPKIPSLYDSWYRKGKTYPLLKAAENKDCAVMQLFINHQPDWNVRDQDGNTPLMISIHSKHEEGVQLLLSHGADLNDTNNKDQTAFFLLTSLSNAFALPLFVANKHKLNDLQTKTTILLSLIEKEGEDLESLKILIEAGADPSILGNYEGTNVTPLYLATRLGKIYTVLFLLEQGVSPNQTVENGKIPLSVANDSILINILLQAGSNIHHRDNGGRSIFSTFSEKGQLPFVEHLLESGHNLSDLDNEGNTPLFYSVRGRTNSFLYMTVLFLHNEADPHHCNLQGETPIFDAVRWGNLAIIEQLLLRKVDLAHRNHLGMTSLGVGISNKTTKLKVVEKLLQAGADPDGLVRYKDSLVTPLHVTDDPAMIALLKRYGANLNKPNEQGRSPLAQAVVDKQYEKVKALINAGADVNSMDSECNSILHITHSDEFINVNIMELLLKHGADVHALNKEGETPLIYTLRMWQRKDEDKIRLLLRYGAKLQLDVLNKLPLHTFCKYYHAAPKEHKYEIKKIIEILLIKGADINQCDAEECTPLDYAMRLQDAMMIRILLRSGADPYVGKASDMILSKIGDYYRNGERLTLFLTDNHAADRENDAEEYLINGVNTVVEFKLNSLLNLYIEKLLTHFTHVERSLAVKEVSPLLQKAKLQIFDREHYLNAIFDVNETDNEGNTLLWYAVLAKAMPICEILIKKGADINQKNRHGATPLHAAIIVNDVKMVRWLREHHANVELTLLNEAITPLRLALLLDRRRIVKDWLDIFFDLNDIQYTKLKEDYLNSRFSSARIGRYLQPCHNGSESSLASSLPPIDSSYLPYAQFEQLTMTKRERKPLSITRPDGTLVVPLAKR